MASLHTCVPPSSSIGIFRRPSPGPYASLLIPANRTAHYFNSSLNLRLKEELKLQAKNRWRRLSASKTNPPEKLDDTKSSGNALGPPLLTILAGVTVFLFIAWIIGSLVMWIIGFIIHPPQLK